MEPSEQERATECVTPAEVIAKINAVSRQPVDKVTPYQLREHVGPGQHLPLWKVWYPTIHHRDSTLGVLTGLSAEKLVSRSHRVSRCA